MEINRIKKVKSLILKSFFFLERDYLYRQEINEARSDLFDENLDVEYINVQKHRTITVSYTRRSNEEERYTFSVSIVRDPYISVEDYFSLSFYLESIGFELESSLFGNFNLSAAETIIQKISQSLKEHCAQIIEGELWLNDYYPRKD